MSARRFRRRRWEQETNIRPAVRARRERYTGYDVDVAFETGYLSGTRDTVRRHEIRDMVERARLADPDRFHQLADAVELDGEDGKEALEALAREWGIFPEGDDLLDLADAAGVSPIGDIDGEHLVDEIERWLRDEG